MSRGTGVRSRAQVGEERVIWVALRLATLAQGHAVTSSQNLRGRKLRGIPALRGRGVQSHKQA